MNRTSVGAFDGACEHAALAVARALYAAEPEDEVALDEHLPQCSACRTVLAESYAVAAAIGSAVPSLDPPESLRDTVIARARETRPTRPSTRIATAEPTSADGPRSPEAAAVAAAAARESAPGAVRRASRGLLLVSAAVVLAVALLAGQAVLGGSSSDDTQAGGGGGGDGTSQVADRAQEVVDRAEAQDPGVRHALLRARDGRTLGVVLDSGDPRDGGGSQVAGASTAQSFVALDMPSPESGRSWVLWGTAGAGTGGPTAIGVIDPSTGRPLPTGAAPPEGGWRGYAISVEDGDVAPETPGRVLGVGPVTA